MVLCDIFALVSIHCVYAFKCILNYTSLFNRKSFNAKIYVHLLTGSAVRYSGAEYANAAANLEKKKSAKNEHLNATRVC